MIKQLDKFHKTKPGYLVFGLVELAIAYGFMGLSIDRGNLFWYLLTLIFLVGAIRNFFSLIGAFSRGKK
jgi:hypothetical protein